VRGAALRERARAGAAAAHAPLSAGEACRVLLQTCGAVSAAAAAWRRARQEADVYRLTGEPRSAGCVGVCSAAGGSRFCSGGLLGRGAEAAGAGGLRAGGLRAAAPGCYQPPRPPPAPRRPRPPPACQVTKRSSKKTQARRSSLKAFVKVVNYQHMMPTRYQLDVDLKAVVTPEAVDDATKKVEARKVRGGRGWGRWRARGGGRAGRARCLRIGTAPRRARGGALADATSGGARLVRRRAASAGVAERATGGQVASVAVSAREGAVRSRAGYMCAKHRRAARPLARAGGQEAAGGEVQDVSARRRRGRGEPRAQRQRPAASRLAATGAGARRGASDPTSPAPDVCRRPPSSPARPSAGARTAGSSPSAASELGRQHAAAAAAAAVSAAAAAALEQATARTRGRSHRRVTALSPPPPFWKPWGAGTRDPGRRDPWLDGSWQGSCGGADGRAQAAHAALLSWGRRIVHTQHRRFASRPIGHGAGAIAARSCTRAAEATAHCCARPRTRGGSARMQAERIAAPHAVSISRARLWARSRPRWRGVRSPGRGWRCPGFAAGARRPAPPRSAWLAQQ
jgi:hypothetical protein